MRRLLPLLLHSTCVLLYGYTIYFDYKVVSDLERSGKYRYPIPGLHFSKLVWLTVINLYVQFIYHCIGAVLSLSAPSAEKAATPTRESAVRREFHFFSTTLIFPIAITVVVLFWSLYFINPKLVMDEQGKRILAISWFNHAIHTVPAAVMITDHVLWSHPRQTSSRTVLVTVISFACLYIALVHFVWFFWNFWAYPILGELIPPLRILFIIFCSLFMYAAYLIGDSILRLRQWFDAQPVMKTDFLIICWQLWMNAISGSQFAHTSAVMGLFRVLIYGIIFGVYAAAIVYDVRYIPRPVSQWWISKLVMLSMINLTQTLQCVYAAICLICALFDWKDEIEHRRSAKSLHVPSYWRQSKLHRICDFLYSTSVFPAGMATCILFWSLYAVNPSFVMPKWVVKIIPAWLNHVTHTAPAGFLLVDTLLTCHHAPSRWLGSVIVFVLYIFYVAIVLGVRLTERYWLYPVFEQLQNVQIALLLTLSGVLFWFLYLIGDGLNVMLWGRAPHSTVTPTSAAKGVKQK